jgi:hypothetical protein
LSRLLEGKGPPTVHHYRLHWAKEIVAGFLVLAATALAEELTLIALMTTGMCERLLCPEHHRNRSRILI